MTNRYAEKTDVSPDRSRAEIERTLVRYGADQFLYGWDQGGAVIAFRRERFQIKLTLPLPDRRSKEFTLTPAKRFERTQDEAEKAFDQAVRQRWRALALVIKAKLEAVDLGITTFEEEFLAYVMLPNGQRVGDAMIPQVELAYETGKMPELLPGQ